MRRGREKKRVRWEMWRWMTHLLSLDHFVIGLLLYVWCRVHLNTKTDYIWLHMNKCILKNWGWKKEKHLFGYIFISIVYRLYCNITWLEDTLYTTAVGADNNGMGNAGDILNMTKGLSFERASSTTFSFQVSLSSWDFLIVFVCSCLV